MNKPEKEEQELVKKYLDTLSPKEKIAYNIALAHLESSFDIMSSIGYIQFKDKHFKRT